ncbi:MAG: P-II family nitrogen regulator [Blastocatellia bacterium]|nr:P-II family nitrogen regulator [Blastocatellia bacterium]MCS7156268.1 P-II family nitrogen regulator [Blastocatellia bacterium]MCX7751382.1 P-II family nitrogen regulator [Blastocatellia bacterium]MDW8169095.1 P-II family nitrogen regulator [Acidobacteriota bacterium]MDW8255799.1 P-II family nitrogen regulator [Acidobacteriota bacterium]
MKCVIAFIQPQHVERVLEALDRLPVRGLSLTEVRGFGRGRAQLLRESPSGTVRQFSAKVRLEIVCRDAEAETIARTIQQAAHTGRPGDGKIFIAPIERAISIVTGEEDDAAL